MTMDHAEALERIEIAAAEPEGIERLMAGDTPEAAAVAGHLAGCGACTDELARIRRSSAIVRDVVRSEPDPALRERTLAYVRAVGRDRSGVSPGAAAASPPDATAAVAPRVASIAVARPRFRLGWVAGLAAGLIVAGAMGFAAGGAWLSGQNADRDREVAVLEDAATTAMRIAAQPDARSVTLEASDPSSRATGSLLLSASGGELVMTATGLVPLAAGEEYGCWVETDGERRRLGRMYWAGDTWSWAGPADGLSALPEGVQFGVSRVPAGGGAGEPVLTGEL